MGAPGGPTTARPLCSQHAGLCPPLHPQEGAQGTEQARNLSCAGDDAVDVSESWSLECTRSVGVPWDKQEARTASLSFKAKHQGYRSRPASWMGTTAAEPGRQRPPASVSLRKAKETGLSPETDSPCQ